MTGLSPPSLSPLSLPLSFPLFLHRSLPLDFPFLSVCFSCTVVTHEDCLSCEVDSSLLLAASSTLHPCLKIRVRSTRAEQMQVNVECGVKRGGMQDRVQLGGRAERGSRGVLVVVEECTGGCVGVCAGSWPHIGPPPILMGGNSL